MKTKTGLRVLLVTPRYFPLMGGIETHVHEVGTRLAQAGIEVTLLTTFPPQTCVPAEECIAGMRVLRVPVWPEDSDFYLAPAMAEVIAQGNWDLVHCQGVHTLVPLIAMWEARKAKIPYVLTFHTGGHASGLRTGLRAVQWHLLRPFLARATRLIGVSRFEADYFRDLLRLPANQFLVIPNGVTTLATDALIDESPIAGTLIVSVGRLERYKGHQRLITALPFIRQQRPDARLLILGTGPYEGELRLLAELEGVADAVEIRSLPAHDRQGMARTLAGAALVALLSEYEAHPIAVLEALSIQRPVLVANTSGLRELGQQGLARTVELNSTPQEIARAALHQINEPLVPATTALPTWDECTSQLIQVYEETVAIRGSVCVF